LNYQRLPTAETGISPEISDKLIISLNKKFLGNLPYVMHLMGVTG